MALVCFGVGIAICATVPQPRAVAVIRAFLLVILWLHLIYPTVKAIVRTVVLIQAR
eukprot:CAMPEP_0183570006 /NCGR_PEP_ID=MMETSP0371-20130417/121901_1 /TAXON_ID=268820 /ORGANISM="Peridinium aciculiferum, Strain PAER-2" /LENGTH=55 /DNA_ID=CAMNT_0025779643 /DNA_START=25 /DNA_END=188 /DNA_ORIENTATION=-